MKALAAAFLVACAACGPSEIGPVGGPSSGNDARPASGDAGACRASCPGCCIGDVCFQGDNNQACGKTGEMCAVCGSGATCVDHSCGAPTDPCMGVSTTGRCKSATTIEICVQPSGAGLPQLETSDCRTGENCQLVSGEAKCVLAGDCVEGNTECVNATTLRTCQGGNWVSSTCSTGCVDSALGDSCAAAGGLVTINGSVEYEARGPNGDRSDWGATFNAPAQGFLIAAVRQGPSGTTYFDTAVTTAVSGNQGKFSLDVPASPTVQDKIVVYAAGTRMDGSMSFVVADPRFTPRDDDYPTSQIPSSPAVWSWSWQASDVTNGETLHISEANGSGAARLFDYLRYVYALGDVRWPGMPKDPLVVWLGLGVSWTCGACQAGWATTQFGTRFGAQIWIPGSDDDSFWADAVTAHELGHWIMGTFGRSVGEGGRHCFGVPSAPGLAWSEGWATWFSSDARGTSIYLDKQGGTMLWLDIATRNTSGSGWPKPTSARGLLQDIYENEVSYIMWQISSVRGVGHDPFDIALSSSRMTVAPFERGYTRHTWDVNMMCQRINIADTAESTTHLADFLDALRCGGVPRADIDAATEPTTRYPYPSGSPQCR